MLEQVIRLERRQRNEAWALRYKYVFRVVGTASKNSLDHFFSHATNVLPRKPYLHQGASAVQEKHSCFVIPERGFVMSGHTCPGALHYCLLQSVSTNKFKSVRPFEAASNSCFAGEASATCGGVQFFAYMQAF
jgi:hypothetical protein